MVRIIIKKGTKWLQVFKLTEVFIKYFKLSKYDAIRLAYTTQSHDVIIQGSSDNLSLFTAHVKLRKLNIDTSIEEVNGIKIQIDLNQFELQRMGMPYHNKLLWESKTNLLIFKDKHKKQAS